MGCDMEMSHSLTLWTQVGASLLMSHSLTLWTQVGASLLSGNHLLQNFTFMANF